MAVWLFKTLGNSFQVYICHGADCCVQIGLNMNVAVNWNKWILKQLFLFSNTWNSSINRRHDRVLVPSEWSGCARTEARSAHIFFSFSFLLILLSSVLCCYVVCLLCFLFIFLCQCLPVNIWQLYEYFFTNNNCDFLWGINFLRSDISFWQ